MFFNPLCMMAVFTGSTIEESKYGNTFSVLFQLRNFGQCSAYQYGFAVIEFVCGEMVAIYLWILVGDGSVYGIDDELFIVSQINASMLGIRKAALTDTF